MCGNTIVKISCLVTIYLFLTTHIHRVTEYSEWGGTHKDYQVQFLAVQRTIPKVTFCA